MTRKELMNPFDSDDEEAVNTEATPQNLPSPTPASNTTSEAPADPVSSSNQVSSYVLSSAESLLSIFNSDY